MKGGGEQGKRALNNSPAPSMGAGWGGGETSPVLLIPSVLPQKFVSEFLG
jgi:hypothetical protein